MNFNEHFNLKNNVNKTLVDSYDFLLSHCLTLDRPSV